MTLALLLAMGFCGRQIDRDLVSAAADGNSVAVKRLLEEGANIEARELDDWTALTIASDGALRL
jgi:hypothetical protein